MITDINSLHRRIRGLETDQRRLRIENETLRVGVITLVRMLVQEKQRNIPIRGLTPLDNPGKL